MIDKKEAYRQKAEAMIDQLEARLEQMRAKLAEEGADAKVKLAEGIDALEKQRDAARVKLDQVLHAGGETWDELKGEADEFLGELKSGFDRFLDRIKQPDQDADASSGNGA